MSGPPPPPPPMMSLPVASDSGGEQGRNMLLQSIRAGKPLKKTVTVDKSAPAVAGKIKGEHSSTSSSGGYHSNSNSNGSLNNNSNTGVKSLGGLFAGGMPKLKPTGLRAAVSERDGPSLNVTQSSNANTNAKRGPPPVPPPATQKPQIFQTASDSSIASPEAPKAFGKPTLVPKPPPPPSIAAPQKPSPPPFLGGAPKPSPPPKKINISNLHSNSGGVSRAQSMRVPRSHPVVTPTLSSLHQSQDCLNDPPPPPRPTPRHLRPPVTRPPPPPPSRVTAAPSMPPPPPPPPHRSGNPHQRHAPRPPPPPTPPTRGSSMMRNGQSNWLDFEARFADAFHSASTFPIPEPFKGFPKVYNSRNAAKQQAPAPPPTPNTMLQLNSTHGGRQWPNDAASSAC